MRKLKECPLHPHEIYGEFHAWSKTERGRIVLKREYLLPVECFHQRLSVTCLAACVRMVLHYYGDPIDEVKFYRDAQLSKRYEGLCDACIAMPLIRRGFKVTTYWNGELEDWGVWTADLAKLYAEHERKALKTKKYAHRRNASIELIKRYVQKSIPVIAEVLAGRFYHSKEIGTHMILVRGFNKQGFFICDPWGMEHVISYEHFKKAWIPSKKFGRSMIVIEPISRPLSR